MFGAQKNVRLCFMDSCFKLTRRDFELILPGKDAQGL